MTRVSAVTEESLVSIVKIKFRERFIVKLMNSLLVSRVSLPLIVHNTLPYLKYVLQSYIR